MTKPTDRFTVSHLFTSSRPTVSSVASVGCTLSSPQLLPAPLMTNSPILFAQLNLLVQVSRCAAVNSPCSSFLSHHHRCSIKLSYLILEGELYERLVSTD